MTLYLLSGAAYGFAAAMQPGPFQTYLIAETVRNGPRRTFPIVFAPLLSDGPIIGLVLLVLSRFPSWWLQALRFAGGIFLLYLAAGTLRATRSPGPSVDPSTNAGRSVLRAATVNLLNPGPYVYWSLVTGPLLLAGWQEAPANGLGLLAGFYGTMLASSAGLMLICAGTGRLGPGISRGLLGLSGVGLFCFGIYQIWTGVLAGWKGL